MAQGFICQAEPVAGIGTSLALGKRIALGVYTSRDAYATAIPAGGYWSHLELVLLKESGTPASVTGMITYDAEGDNPAWTLTTAATLTAALTTANTYVVSIPIDRWCRYPFGNDDEGAQVALSPPNLSLFLAVNNGAVTLVTARLQWRDGHSGG